MVLMQTNFFPKDQECKFKKSLQFFIKHPCNASVQCELLYKYLIKGYPVDDLRDLLYSENIDLVLATTSLIADCAGYASILLVDDTVKVFETHTNLVVRRCMIDCIQRLVTENTEYAIFKIIESIADKDYFIASSAMKYLSNAPYSHLNSTLEFLKKQIPQSFHVFHLELYLKNILSELQVCKKLSSTDILTRRYATITIFRNFQNNTKLQEKCLKSNDAIIRDFALDQL
jgi:hypothetical protein